MIQNVFFRKHFLITFISLFFGFIYPLQAAHTQASLVSEKNGIAPGKSFWVGIYLDTEEGWHTYTDPSGDAGFPTAVEWILPDGFKAGPIQWPKAQRFEENGLIAYGYEGPILLPIQIQAPEKISSPSVTLHAKVRWLECKILCVPGEQELSLELPILTTAELQNSPQAAFFKSLTTKHSIQKKTEKEAGSQHLGIILVWAFFGGLILNLMPCVFPVLGLKIMGFVRHAQNSQRSIRIQGLTFTLGVLISFWLLSSILLVLRAQGESLGWGFQLQSSGFVVFLIALLFLLALSFLGVFEIGMGLSNAGSQLAQKEGLKGSFFSGMLATLVATPCTAPFMGVALGFALSQPPWIAFIVFTSLALGMSSPYLALSYFPNLLKYLPKAGPWMDAFKQAMAFPLLATIVWLLWVLGLQKHIHAVVEVLFALVILGLGGWIYGCWYTLSQTKKVKWIALFFSAISILSALGLFIDATEDEEESNKGLHASTPLDWEPYSAERLATLRAQEQPIFIDFTAAWCLTCQANFKAVLSTPEVTEAFKDHHIALLMADWTRRDPQITEALSQLGRSGVPAYVLYPSDPDKDPIILPEVLTVDIVLNALKQA